MLMHLCAYVSTVYKIKQTIRRPDGQSADKAKEYEPRDQWVRIPNKTGCNYSFFDNFGKKRDTF